MTRRGKMIKFMSKMLPGLILLAAVGCGGPSGPDPTVLPSGGDVGVVAALTTTPWRQVDYPMSQADPGATGCAIWPPGCDCPYMRSRFRRIDDETLDLAFYYEDDANIAGRRHGAVAFFLYHTDPDVVQATLWDIDYRSEAQEPNWDAVGLVPRAGILRLDYYGRCEGSHTPQLQEIRDAKAGWRARLDTSTWPDLPIVMGRAYLWFSLDAMCSEDGSNEVCCYAAMDSCTTWPCPPDEWPYASCEAAGQQCIRQTGWGGLFGDSNYNADPTTGGYMIREMPYGYPYRTVDRSVDPPVLVTKWSLVDTEWPFHASAPFAWRDSATGGDKKQTPKEER